MSFVDSGAVENPAHDVSKANRDTDFSICFIIEFSKDVKMVYVDDDDNEYGSLMQQRAQAKLHGLFWLNDSFSKLPGTRAIQRSNGTFSFNTNTEQTHKKKQNEGQNIISNSAVYCSCVCISSTGPEPTYFIIINHAALYYLLHHAPLGNRFH